MASEHDVARILREWNDRGSKLDLHIDLPPLSVHFVGTIDLLTLPAPDTPTTLENRRVRLHDDHGNWVEVPIPPENSSTFERTEEIDNLKVRDHKRRHGELSCLNLMYQREKQDGYITLAELEGNGAVERGLLPEALG